MKANKKHLIIILAVSVLVSLTAVIMGRQCLLSNPFVMSEDFSNPYYICAEKGCGSAIVAGGRRRIICCDEHRRVTGIIRGGFTANSTFYHAVGTAVSKNSIFIIDARLEDNDIYPDAEKILEFDLNGHFIETRYELSYRNNDIPISERQRHHICHIGSYENDIYFVERIGNALYLYKLAEGAELPLLVRVVESPEVKKVLRAAYSGKNDEIWFTARDGCIYRETNEHFVKVFDGDKNKDSSVSGIACCDDGSVYCTDTGRKIVMKIFPNNETVMTAPQEQSTAAFMDVSACGRDLYVICGSGIYFVSSNGSKLSRIEKSPCTLSFAAERLFVWLCAAYLVVFITSLIIFCIKKTISGSKSKEFKAAIKIVIIMLITAGCTSAYILIAAFNFHEKNIASMTEQLTKTLAAKSQYTYGDAFERINKLSDYGGKDYWEVRRHLDFACEKNDHLIITLYYIAGKVSDEIYYCSISYDDETNVRSPMYSKKDFDGYWDVMERNIQTFRNSEDYLGVWSGTVAPILNSKGGAVGTLEVGYDVTGYRKEIKKIIANVLYTVLILLVGILLVFAEVTPFMETVSKRRRAAKLKIKPVILEISRTIEFAASFAAALPAVFIVRETEKLFLDSQISLMPAGVAAALPLSAMVFITPKATNFGAMAAERFGFRMNALTGSLVLVISGCVSAAAFYLHSYIMIVSGFALAGVGIGLCKPNCLCAFEKDETRRMKLLGGCTMGATSGTLLGSSAGGFAADFSGCASVFMIQCAAALVIALLAVIFLDREVGKRSSSDEAQGKRKISTLRFLLNPQFLFFILCAILPTSLLTGYWTYLFPMYAANEDLGTIQIGNIVLFAGAFSVFVSAPLASFMTRYMSLKKMMAFMSALAAEAFIAFWCFTGISASIAVLFITIMCVSINNIALGTYYVSMDVIKDYGRTKSMAQLALKIASCNSVAILAFGTAAGKIGMSRGTALIGITAAVLAVLFALFADPIKRSWSVKWLR